MTEAQAWLVVEYAMMLDQLVGSFDGRHVEGADVAGVARSVTVVEEFLAQPFVSEALRVLRAGGGDVPKLRREVLQ